MELTIIDWSIIVGYFLFTLVVGLWVSKRAGKSSEEFFLSGRSMPWWLLGISMVATTFSTDTPNLVSDMVRQDGIAGNWKWWAFLLTGMVTVFIYAKLWRRSGMMTDVEFYELRYSGKAARFLRGFRALYLGVFFNVVIMASVTLAAIKIAGIMLGWGPWVTVLVAGAVTVVYSMLGGLRGVILTDFVLFLMSMIGAIIAAVYAVNIPEVGGLTNMLKHPEVSGKLNFIPAISNWELFVSVFLIPLAVQWWSVWYPGAEPGGGGYLVQRMLSARNEKHAMGATLLFNVAHYALRPWPWIIVALASIVVWPDLEALKAAHPNIAESVMGHDIAYPAMLLKVLPHGLLGVVVASLIAAYMSTISTHLNWGSSYVVNDFYERFWNPDASEQELVWVGRISTLVLMLLTILLAPLLQHAEKAFNLMLQIGAGTGSIFLLRWFWWRVNAFSELTGMIVSFVIALYFELIHSSTGLPALEDWQRLLWGVGITTSSWIIVSFLTRPTNDETLFNFLKTVKVGGPGWTHIFQRAREEDVELEAMEEKWDLPFGVLMMFIGTIAIYATLFATGSFIYGDLMTGSTLTVIALAGYSLLVYFWPRLEFK